MLFTLRWTGRKGISVSLYVESYLPIKKVKKVYPITFREVTQGGIEVWPYPFFDVDAR